MPRPNTTIAILFVALLLGGCGNGASQSRLNEGALASAEEIEALIEQLAISDEPAAHAPVFSPTPDTPRTDPRVIAYQAADKLKSYGRHAFPYLLNHLDDRRQSIAFRNEIPHSVGLSCYRIIEMQVLRLPKDYHVTYQRAGTDGEIHTSPSFAEAELFQPDITTWLAEREDQSLADMQIEALEWLIEREERIGFPTEQDREWFLYPLQRQVERIRAGK